MTKPIFTDVTDQFEPKQRNGNQVTCVLKSDIPLDADGSLLLVMSMLDGKPDTSTHLETGHLHDKKNISQFDLIPRRTVNPLDGLPLDHWWRVIGYTEFFKITSVTTLTVTTLTDIRVRFSGTDWERLEALKTDYQHTANPLDPSAKWVTGW